MLLTGGVGSGGGEESVINMEVVVGRRLNGNMACVMFPTAGLTVGTSFEVVLDGSEFVGNVTIV